MAAVKKFMLKDKTRKFLPFLFKPPLYFSYLAHQTEESNHYRVNNKVKKNYLVLQNSLLLLWTSVIFYYYAFFTIFCISPILENLAVFIFVKVMNCSTCIIDIWIYENDVNQLYIKKQLRSMTDKVRWKCIHYILCTKIIEYSVPVLLNMCILEKKYVICIWIRKGMETEKHEACAEKEMS